MDWFWYLNVKNIFNAHIIQCDSSTATPAMPPSSCPLQVCLSQRAEEEENSQWRLLTERGTDRDFFFVKMPTYIFFAVSLAKTKLPLCS